MISVFFSWRFQELRKTHDKLTHQWHKSISSQKLTDYWALLTNANYSASLLQIIFGVTYHINEAEEKQECFCEAHVGMAEKVKSFRFALQHCLKIETRAWKLARFKYVMIRNRQSRDQHWHSKCPLFHPYFSHAGLVLPIIYEVYLYRSFRTEGLPFTGWRCIKVYKVFKYLLSNGNLVSAFGHFSWGKSTNGCQF